MNKLKYLILALALAGCSRGNDVLWLAGGPMEPSGEPYYEYRILDHWDNLDDSVERGYAGKSIFEWTSDKVPEERLRTYGRLNQSIGINGSVLDNVNANPKILTEQYLERVAQIADILRDYGIRTYLAINFATPLALKELPSADPLDPAVADWWKAKVAQIYKAVPDFGGFLVKASSEGQPGPQQFGRSHADGANMLADALAPYGGTVMWRAFVYAPNSPDRANQAAEEFNPLDGQFRSNVIIQIKNGPVDFQPREPVSPLFFSLKQTPSMPELQVTMEYLGQDKHLVFLGPMWEEFFAQSLAGVSSHKAIAGVANTGQDENWCGHIFAQANWYAFGRMAWDPTLSSEQIADEWIRGTFPKPFLCSKSRYEKEFVEPIKEMMLSSRETCVNYMMPLGLHHMFAQNHHYGPGVEYSWPGARRDWLPQYYHQAGPDGVGFDRTMATGSGNTGQYPEPLRSMYENIETCPENLLLWFHHVPWDYRMKNGKTLWENLQAHYEKGTQTVSKYIDIWNSVKPFVDEDKWQQVSDKLKIQEQDALVWKETVLSYFGKLVEQ